MKYAIFMGFLSGALFGEACVGLIAHRTFFPEGLWVPLSALAASFACLGMSFLYEHIATPTHRASAR